MSAPNRATTLFFRASALPEDKRRAFLDSECEADGALRAEVESLLFHDQRAARVLARFGLGGVFQPEGAAAAVDEAPEQIGPYRLIDVVAEGGMGVVHLAEQTEPLSRKVALKLIKIGMDTKEVIARFESERRTLALMNHPNVARIIEAGATGDGRPYFVMGFIDGPSITDYCDEQRLDVRARVALFLQVCAGVRHAHQKGIIHRDLKPSNVLVPVEGGRATPKVIDFGVAKATLPSPAHQASLTTVGQRVGTPNYMSPEQTGTENADIDTRSDVYSLGVLLYELLAGVLPFDLDGAGIEESLRTIRQELPARPSVRLGGLRDDAVEGIASRRATDGGSLRRRLRGDLDAIILRALEKDRSRRYASVADLAGDLDRHLQSRPIEARPPGRIYRIGRFLKRHPLGISIAGLVLAGLVGLGAAMAIQSARVQERLWAQGVSDLLLEIVSSVDPAGDGRSDLTARELFDAAAERIDTDLADRPIVQARMMNVMGRIYRELADHDASEGLLRRALDLRTTHLGPDSLETAESWNDLGGTLQVMLELEQAEAAYREALEIRERKLGRHLDVARTLNNLGNTLRRQKRLDEAEPLLLRSLDMKIYLLGEENLDVASTQMNLAALHRARQEWGRAEELLLRATKVREALLAPDHVKIASARNALAAVYHSQGRHADAERLFRSALQVWDVRLPPDHPKLAFVRNNLSLALKSQGEYEQAEVVLREALRILDDNPDTRAGDIRGHLVNLVDLLRIQSKHAEMEPPLLRILEIPHDPGRQTSGEAATQLEGWAEDLRRAGRSATAAELDSRAARLRAEAAAGKGPVAGG